jgi:hypothetical protein
MGGAFVDAAADLRGRDLGAVLGVASRVSLAEEAGAVVPRKTQCEDQRHWCDLSRPHAPTSPGDTQFCSFAIAGGRRF